MDICNSHDYRKLVSHNYFCRIFYEFLCSLHFDSATCNYKRKMGMSAIKEDIRTMWERGVSVHVIASKYSCEPIDIMRILGIWE